MNSVPRRGNQRLRVNELWLVRLRWVAVVGQLLTVAVASLLLRVELPLGPLLGLIAVTTASNLAFAGWIRRQSVAAAREPNGGREHFVLVVVMTLDLIALTGLLFLTGGPANPFTIFFFVNLALAAVILPARSVWGLTLLAVLCLLTLYFWHRPLPELSREIVIRGAAQPGLTLGQLGFLVAFTGCAGVVSHFITRVTRELQQRERELRNAEQQRARSERLEALATLAAGAGHELASPLSTIAVIANDLSRHLEGTEVPASVLEDVQLIRGELDHCRTILDSLASGAGQAFGEEMHPLPVDTLVDEIVGGLRRKDRVEVTFDESASRQRLVLPRVAIGQAIRGILRNALDASPEDRCVALRIGIRDGWCRLIVADQGEGMPPEILARAGEPFFTTKEPGQGMGLGIFLTRNLIERLDGRFSIDSQPGRGTTVEIRLPVEEQEGR